MKQKYILAQGIGTWIILDENDQVVWKGYRGTMKQLRTAQAKLRDFRNGERIRKLFERINATSVAQEQAG